MRSALRLLVVIAAVSLATPSLAQRTAPDPLAALPGEISAVLDLATAPRLLVVEDDHGVSNTRTLAVGDEYRGGWRIAGIDARQVTLAKGAEQRTVSVPSRGRAVAVDVASAGGPSAPMGGFRGFASSNSGSNVAGGARVFVAPPQGGRGRGMSGMEAGMQEMLGRIQRGEAPPEIQALIQQMGPEVMSAFQNVQVRNENGVQTITGVGPSGESTRIEIGPNGARNITTMRGE